MSLSLKLINESREAAGMAPLSKRGEGSRSVPQWQYDAAKAVLAEREREFLELKGPCSCSTCRLHYAHSGPCVPTNLPVSSAGAGDEEERR